MDDRAMLGLWTGLVGLTLGVVAAISEVGLLAVLAGVAALGAGALSVRELARTRQAGERAEALERRIADLETELAAQHATSAAAAAEAEAALAPDAAKLNPALVDPSTGLFNEEFFHVTLDARISAARRHLRPVAVVLLEVCTGVREGSPVPADAEVVAGGIRETLREADTACRMTNGYFALVLEDTPENGAVWTVERVRRYLAAEHPEQTMWAGVACYPAHAFDAAEILDRAAKALEAAKEWRQDRIEVATSE